eukprot:3473148-Rhodomonas_salina.1
MARGWEAETARRAMAMAEYSPLIGTASPPTRPDKRKLGFREYVPYPTCSPISGPRSRLEPSVHTTSPAASPALQLISDALEIDPPGTLLRPVLLYAPAECLFISVGIPTLLIHFGFIGSEDVSRCSHVRQRSWSVRPRPLTSHHYPVVTLRGLFEDRVPFGPRNGIKEDQL